jgi:hypothetical protein
MLIDARATFEPAARARRPSSLAEVAASSAAHGGIDAFLREFLDAYHLESDSGRRAAMVAQEPPLLASERANAYLAAVAEHLSHADERVAPDWVEGAPRFLHLPFFPAGLESLKATLLVESPAAFRRRLIFVGFDPLYRPRRDSAGITP